MRIVVTRGGRRARRSSRSCQPLPEHAGAGHDRRTRRTRVLDGVKSLSYAREHARDAAGAGAGRRRGAARHAARPRAGGPDVLVLLCRWTARRSSRRRSATTSWTRSRAATCSSSPTRPSRSSPATSCAARARRSWPRPRARSSRSPRSTTSRFRPRPARSRRTRRAAIRRAHRAGSSRRLPPSMRVLTVIGNRPQFVKAAAVSRLLRAEHDELLVHTGQHHDDELSTIFFERARRAAARASSCGIAGGTQHRADRADARRARAAAGRRAARRRARLRRHELDARRRAGRGAGATSRSPTSRRACARSTARCPRSSTACSPTTSPTLLLCPRRRRSQNLERERVAGRVELVGDVMVDVALLFQPRARADDEPLRDAGVSAGRVRPRHGAPRGQRRRSRRGCARWSTCCSRCRCPSSCRCTRAPARAWRPPAGSTSCRPPSTCAWRRRWATWPSRRC